MLMVARKKQKQQNTTLLRKYRDMLRRLQLKYSFVGILLATSWFVASLTPSLVPRPWYLQGFVAGLSWALGYYVGAGLSIAYRKSIRKEPHPRFKQLAWIVLSAWVLFVPAYELGNSVLYQRKITEEITGAPYSDLHASVTILQVLLTALVVAFVVRVIARTIYRVYSAVHAFFLRHGLVRKLPKRVYRTVVALLAATIVFYFITDAGLRTLRGFANTFFKAGNAAISSRYVQPTDPLLSGSEDSLVSWESLGAPGRQFVAAPPSRAQLQEFHGTTPVKQPIRAYVGIEASDNLREQARLAVKELERTGAFDRKVIQIVNTTGSGGIDLAATRPVEYMYAGDTATVAIQYSYFPSWLSLITDRERAKSAAFELTTQIQKAQTKHIKNHGSAAQIYMFGESLGSYGLEAAFPSVGALTERSDKVFLVGPPGFNPIRERFADSGDTDSAVAFINNPALTRAVVNDRTEIAYLENATDPVIRWDPELIWNEPRWIYAQTSRSNDRFEWYPVVSFLQITVDMALALDVPVGYGHRYGVDSAEVWRELIQSTDWDDAKQQKLEDTLHSFYL